MLRPALILTLSAALMTPALAWDPAKAGRYGGLDLDKLDVGGAAQMRGDLTVGGAARVKGILSLTDDRPPVLQFYNDQPDNYAVLSPGGARVSMKSVGGHDTYGKWGADSLRAMFALRAVSQADAGIEETTAIIEHRGVTGYSAPWYSALDYPAGAQVKGGNGYIFETDTACKTANSKPTAVYPSDPHPPQIDGTCTWKYVGIGAGNNKTPLLVTGSIEAPKDGKPGGGEGWGIATIMDVQSGAWPRGGGFAVGQEIDMGNNVRDCPPVEQYACQMYGVFLNGNGLYPSTVGMYIGGTQGFHIGLLLDGNSAGDIGISNSSRAKTGYYDTGQHEIASVLDRSTSGYAIKLEGNYSAGQIAGSGWGVSAGGGLSASSISTPNTVFAGAFAAYVSNQPVVGVSCSGPPTAQFQVTNGIVTRC